MENAMDIDAMKALWQESNRRLEAGMRLNTLLFAQSNLRRVDSSRKEFKRGITLELLVNFAGVFLLGWFAANYVREPRFLIPAMLLDIYAIALVAAGVRRLVELGKVDYDEPVVAIAERLQRLRVSRVRTMMWTLLFGPLMWVPLLIVAARGFFGVDVYATTSPAWLAASVLFGLAMIPAGILIARRFGARLERYSVIRALADEIAGRSLATALDDLAAIRRFAEED
jgi:hypothetical protein